MRHWFIGDFLFVGLNAFSRSFLRSSLLAHPISFFSDPSGFRFSFRLSVPSTPRRIERPPLRRSTSSGDRERSLPSRRTNEVDTRACTPLL